MTPAALDLLRCPRTGSRLQERTDGSLQSAEGDHIYPVVHGIADFRLFDPPYMSRGAEAEVADKIVEAGKRMSYDQLLRYFEEDIWPAGRAPEQIRKQLEHRLTLRHRSPHRLDYLFRAVGDTRIPRGGAVLDLGCGSGEATAALYERGAATVIGIDISMVELVLAKKLLAEEGKDALLAAGCAEALPLAADKLDFIYSPDVIEHVTDQHQYLAEARRVLKPGGRILLNSPNRYSVVSPEPHVGIWFMGFLPRALMDSVSRLAGRGPYTGKRLVSLRELRTLLKDNFEQFEIQARQSNPAATSLTGRAYHALRPWSVNAFSVVCDQHIVLASNGDKPAGTR